MAHFAKILNGTVVEVIVAEQSFINFRMARYPGETWVQTSYNTRGGAHLLGGEPLRKNFAGIGFSYDEAMDAFIPPKPHPEWTLNSSTCLWEAPLPLPDQVHIYLWVDGSWKRAPYRQTLTLPSALQAGVSVVLPHGKKYIGSELKVRLNDFPLTNPFDYMYIGVSPRSEIQVAFDLSAGDRIEFIID